MAVSLVMMIGIVVRSVRTRRLNDELSKRRAELAQTAEPVKVTPLLMEETPLPLDVMQAADEAEAIDTPAPLPTPDSGPVVSNTIYHRASGTALSHMEELYNENHDLIGWINIPLVLDLPVVYRNNSYYLTRDFYGNKNTSGTLFLDQNHRFGERTQNLLLHGHNMKDGTMFGRLVQYIEDIGYFKRNAFVNYDTLWEQEQYVMFAVLNVSLDTSSEDFVNYFTHPTFQTDEAFNAYIRQLQLHSVYAIPMDVQPSDALLTLSTCLDDNRLVIVCRRVREGESRSQLRQRINLAVSQ